MRTRRAGTALWPAVAVGYAVVAGLARPFTLPADVAAAVAGMTVLLVAAFAGETEPPRPRPVGAGWWAALVALVAVVELVEFSGGPRGAHPTLSSLAAAPLAHWPGRSAAYAAWLLLGCALARR